MPSRMPPPGMTAVSAPPSDVPPTGKSRMPPPGAKDKQSGDGKVPPEQATIVRSDSHCIDCANYDPTSGDCAKISGSFDPQDSCVEYFSKIGDDEPDDDEQGGPPDGDEDDQPGAPA